MASYHDEFPSQFLKAADIQAPYDVTIADVVKENVGTPDKPENKLVAHFKEDGRKPVVLNKTRCEAIEDITSTDDYQQWVGKRVHVAKGTTRFAGRRVDCIVFSAPDLPF
jgi:hypothetical protein